MKQCAGRRREQIRVLPRLLLFNAGDCCRYASGVHVAPDRTCGRWYCAVLQAAFCDEAVPGEGSQGARRVWPAGVLARGLRNDLPRGAPHSWSPDDLLSCFRYVEPRVRGDFAAVFSDYELDSAPEAALVARADFSGEEQELACVLPVVVRRAHAEPVGGRCPALERGRGGLH